MASRSRKPHRHSDYLHPFDDPYTHSPPKTPNRPRYEYVGTEEPLSTLAPDSHRLRRHARTVSPPRHSRHGKSYSPPPRPSHHASARHPVEMDRGQNHNKLRRPNLKDRYQDFAEQNPKLQRYGRQGLTFLGKAAAAYAAANGGKDAVESAANLPADHGDRRDRSRRHHRRHSPSLSPSPPRRHHSARPRDREHERGHHVDHRRRYSASPPPPLIRRPHSYLASRHSPDGDRGRGQRYHRRHSPSPLPSQPRSPRGRHGRRRSTSPPKRTRNSTVPPSSANAERWQAAARAALEAGGLTAFRLRKEPGSWTGDKATKVATAAIGAAAMDAFMDEDPRGARGGVKGLAEGAISSLIASQIVGKGSRRRGR
ncbi:hypothetical protein GGS21DRAFT_123143 [Xylaria nigripes]|nr:hypothetical protein GGS21DRAFT_123143 [Xylaria nigripes]